jgi:hypothetical protein
MGSEVDRPYTQGLAGVNSMGSFEWGFAPAHP